MKSGLSYTVLAVSGLLLTSTAADAAVLFQTGFESPAYTAGPISGQNGWVDNGSGNPVVESTVFAPGGGNQAFHDLGTQFEFADHPLSVPLAGNVFTFEVDYLHSGSNVNDSQSAFGVFGQNAQVDEDFVAQIGYVNGKLFVGNTNASGASPVADVNDRWYHLSLTLDYTNMTMTGRADGQLLGVLPINNSSALTDLKLTTIQSFGGNDTLHYYDNVVVSMVPEPQSAAILGSVALGALARRRAKRV